MDWLAVGRFLIIAGTVVITLGIFFVFADKVPFGKLFGDFELTIGKYRLLLPIATSILISIVITLVMNIFTKR